MTRGRRRRGEGSANAVAAFVCLLLGLTVQCAEKHEAEPDIDALVEAGKRTAERLQTSPASWSATHEGKEGGRFVVDVVRSGDKRRVVLSVGWKGERQELVRIIERDGLWYVREGERRGKYRPFEAPMDFSVTYAYLLRSELQFVTCDLGLYEGTHAGAASYRAPLPDPIRQQLRNTVEDFASVSRESPELLAKPETREALERMRDVLRNGVLTKADLRTGIVVQRGAPGRETRITDFQWVGDVDEREFAVAGRVWADFSGDPTAEGTDDLVMIGHCGFWRPGMKSYELDARLLNVATGRFRRIPFRGAVAMPGCFTKDRTCVVVPGTAYGGGGLCLYEVNLSTGENRQLGGELLAHGFCVMPALSPDGKTVAVLHKGASERLLESQVCLVDLATGEARRVGKPLDTAYVSWLPDGKGLVLITREYLSMDRPSVDTVSRMDMDGKVTPIRPGTQPVTMNDGRTILFRDRGQRLWKTCDLEGRNVKLFGDGLAKFGFPSPAPDGRRVIMMQTKDVKAPLPVVLEIGASEGRPAVDAPGAWAWPSWR